MNTTFSLERAKNGEPFTYDGRECKFGSISPDGSFHFWVLNTYGWASVSFTQRDLNSIIQYLSMTPKKLEVKIWEHHPSGKNAELYKKEDHIFQDSGLSKLTEHQEELFEAVEKLSDELGKRYPDSTTIFLLNKQVKSIIQKIRQ